MSTHEARGSGDRSATAASRYRLDGSYRRPGDGRVVIGGSPLRLLTLSAGGVEVMRSIERDGSPVALDAGVMSLLGRLLDLGIVHPVHDNASDQASDNAPDHTIPGSLTIVTPFHRDLDPAGPTPTGATGAAAGAAVRLSGVDPTIVVDDASCPALRRDEIAAGDDMRDIDGVRLVRLVRLDRNVGPGGARNAGLHLVDTAFVAFVDADVEIDDASIRDLLAWFDDPTVALVAPRIRATAGTGRLARFEALRSPLDLGAEPARVAPTTRVSYVPAAVLVCRTEALRAVGGFDQALRWGEDVDLVWRLHAAGWRCRYEPTVVALHRTRPSLRAWVEQRFRYGTSAAPLAERHPGALAPVRMSGWSAATGAPIAAGIPLLGIAVGVGTTVALVRKLRQVPPIESIRLAGMGNLYAGRLLATTVTRTWWPVAATAAVLSRRARRLLLAAVVVPIVLDRRADRAGRAGRAGRAESAVVDPITYAALHLLDDFAYGAGVWVGAWRRRSAAALLPSFESWPPRDSSGPRGT